MDEKLSIISDILEDEYNCSLSDLDVDGIMEDIDNGEDVEAIIDNIISTYNLIKVGTTKHNYRYN